MPRTTKYNKVLHSLHFTPHQLQPYDVLRWGADAFCYANYNQFKMPQPDLIEKHRFGFVYVAWKADWVRPFVFANATGDAWQLEVETGMTMHAGKRDLLRITASFRAAGQEVVAFDSLLNPLKITGGAALTGVPSGVPDDIRALFQEDEIVTSPPPRLCDATTPAETGELIRDRTTPFVLYRHEGELADMWQNPVLASLDGRAREAMVFDGGDERLKDGLARPIASMSGELRRPIYVHEEGVIYTRAYWCKDHVCYVHEVRGAPRGGGDDSRPTCATVVVHMAPRG